MQEANDKIYSLQDVNGKIVTTIQARTDSWSFLSVFSQ